MTDDVLRQMLVYVKTQHGTQVRNKERPIPYWHHCLNVGSIVEQALLLDGMRDNEIVAAAYGHDLYEDTEATRQEVRDSFGERVDTLIFTLTNEVSDANRVAYMQKLAAADEAATLIKAADMCENMQSVLYSLDILGQDWLNTFFMPIMDDSIKVLNQHVEFYQYPQAGRFLRQSANVSYNILTQKRENYDA